MSYDFAREIDEARLDDSEDWRYEAEQDARDAEHDEQDEVLNRPCVGPYYCTDRMCGASDCAHCHPEGYQEPDELPMRCRSCGQPDAAGLCANCEEAQ